MELIIVIPIAIVAGLLNIILFFKIWGMTNDVRKVLSFLKATRTDLEWNNFSEAFVRVKPESEELSKQLSVSGKDALAKRLKEENENTDAIEQAIEESKKLLS